MGWFVPWLISIVVSVAASAYMRNKQMPDKDRGGIEINRFGTDKEFPVIYGERLAQPVVVYQGVTDVTDGDTTNETYWAILVWCVGEIDSIKQLYFDDLEYSKFGNFGGDGQEVEHFFGADSQSLPEWFKNGAPDDMSNMFFNGLAFTCVKLVMDKEFKRYPQGRPKFSALIRGKKVNRIIEDDYAWSENVADCFRDYLIDTKVGKGIDASEFDAQNWADMAAFCRIPVKDHNGNLRPQMTCNMIVDTGRKLKENIDDFNQICRGYLVDGQRGLRLEIDRQRPVDLHIGVNDLAGGISTTSVNSNERYNQVTVRFPDKENRYQISDAVFPASGSALHQKWLDEDNGVSLVIDEQVEGIDNYSEALQYAEILARKSREGMTLTVEVKGRKAWLLEEMDVVSFDSQLRGWDKKPFSVREIHYSNDKTKLVLSEYQEDIFPWTEKPPRPNIPDTTLPDPNRVNPPANLSVVETPDNSSYWGKLTWNQPAGFVESYQTEIWAGAERVYAQTSRVPEIWIQGLLTGRYVFKVRTVGAVSVSGWTMLTVDVNAPNPPIEVDVETGNTYVILRPKSSQLVFGTTYEFYFLGTEPDGTPELRGSNAVAFQMEGLSTKTKYYFKVRAHNPVGSSGFVDVSATTTHDNSTIIDLIDGSITRKELDSNFNETIDQFDRDIEASKGDINEIKGSVDNITNDTESISRNLFDVTADYNAFRDAYEKRTLEGETLTDAVVQRDPETGQIINLAFNYTEKAFTQAGILIDGVKGEVDISAKRIEEVNEQAGDGIRRNEASIKVNADAIKLRATYDEVNETVGGAIAAITPAYSWQFNTSIDGWSGVAWVAGGYINVAANVFATAPAISFNAADNTAIRIRVKTTDGATGAFSWNGGNQNVSLGTVVGDDWFVLSKTMTESDGWTGEITSLRLVMSSNATIDSIEIGKPTSNQVQLEDITYRMVTVEQELDPENARWKVYVTQDYWDQNALTRTDVQQEINGWDAEWKVTGTIKELNENGTVNKANTASQWVNAAESNITQVVVNFNAQEGGVDDKIDDNSQKITTAQSEIDGLKGTITDTITSTTGMEHILSNDIDTGDLSAVMEAYNQFLSQDTQAKDGVSFAYAQRKLQAVSDKQESMASEMLQLAASVDENAASITEQSKVIANQSQALAENTSQLKAEIAEGDATSLAKSTAYTRSAVGYCLDKDGNITDETDAVVCVSNGGSWFQGVLAEHIRDLYVETGSGTSAKLSTIGQVFEDKDGNLVARGGMTSDVNNRVTGFINTNDGEDTQFDVIAQHFRVGDYVDGNYVPMLYLNQETGDMHYRGVLTLGDGYTVHKKEDFRELSGAGQYNLMLRGGEFPSDDVAKQDFEDVYGFPVSKWDYLTYVSAAKDKAQSKQWDGTKFVPALLVVNGNTLVKGTLTGDTLIAGTEINTPKLIGGTGDFSGKVTMDEAYVNGQMKVGNLSGYSVTIRGQITSPNHDVINVYKDGTGTRFAVRGSGYVYSVGGGYLDNLTIGSNCDIQGKLKATQIDGDIVSGKAAYHSKWTFDNQVDWRTVASASCRASTSGKSRAIAVEGVSVTADVTSRNQSDAFVLYYRVLVNGGVASEGKAYLAQAERSGRDNEYTHFVANVSISGAKSIGSGSGNIKVQVKSNYGSIDITREQQTVIFKLIPWGGEFY